MGHNAGQKKWLQCMIPKYNPFLRQKQGRSGKRMNGSPGMGGCFDALLNKARALVQRCQKGS